MGQTMVRGGRSRPLTILAIVKLAGLVVGRLEGARLKRIGIWGGVTIAVAQVASHARRHALCFSSQHEPFFMPWSIDAIIGIESAHIACVASAGIGAARANMAKTRMSKRFI